jgi:two-component system phosphate regulon sensor histidine kinase PhoR
VRAVFAIAFFTVLFGFACLLVRQIRMSKRLVEIDDFISDLLKGNLGRRLFIEGGGGFSRIMTHLSGLAAFLQDKLGESEDLRARLDIILTSIPDGISIVDPRDRVRSVNPAFEKLFLVKSRGIAGEGLADTLGIPQFNSQLISVRLDRAEKSAVVYLDAQDRYIESIFTPFFDAVGNYAGTVAVFRDITAQKKIDQIRRDFVANVSHELKTPVTAIRGFAETLLDGAIEDRDNAVKFLNTIKFQSERMDNLIKDLITLSKIEFGAILLEKKRIRLEEYVGDVLALFDERAAAKGLSLKKDIHEGCTEIEADPERFMQILINLLDNALKYTETGGVIVRARKAEEGYCIIAVRDTGIGVPKKHISRLGERFFRVDPSRSRELGGTGLGLAIVKHLVLAHGWRMSIESDLGAGTVVRLQIPV